MLLANKVLYDEIKSLPVEKIGKILSYIQYIKQEQEMELFLDPQEEDRFHKILATEEGISSAEMLALIEDLPND